MSQVNNYTVPGSPLTMAELATALLNIFNAIGSLNRGSTPPSNSFNGMPWQDVSAPPAAVLQIYTTAAGWVPLLTVNETTGAVSFPIGTGAIVAAMLASSSVTTDKIAANNVTLSKLARAGSAGDLLSSNGTNADASFKSPSTLNLATNDAVTAAISSALASYAPLASPALSGTPTAPTAASGTNSTQVATTAFVKNQAYAPLASPALTGTPTAPTAGAGTNNTQIATTAFVANAVGSGSYVSKDQNYNNVGSFNFAGLPNSSLSGNYSSPGSAIAGSYLYYVKFNDGGTGVMTRTSTMPGTWRVLTPLTYGAGTSECTYGYGLFQRIA